MAAAGRDSQKAAASVEPSQPWRGIAEHPRFGFRIRFMCWVAGSGRGINECRRGDGGEAGRSGQLVRGLCCSRAQAAGSIEHSIGVLEKVSATLPSNALQKGLLKVR